MEKIDLPEREISGDMDSPPGSPKDSFHIQSLLHAVSNKEKVRTDVDDVDFIKEVNRSRSRKKESTPKKMNPVNIFSHLKNLSDRIEKEDEKKSRSPSVKVKRTPKKSKTPSPRDSPPRKSRTPTPKQDHKNYYEDKALLLQTFFLLQQQGIKSELKLDISSDMHIIKAEVMRMQTELNSQKMIKFMRKGLIAFVSGMEFLNNRYDPFGLHLNGFSEHCMTSLGDYDGVFMRLYDKYKDRTQALAPEVELLMLLLGSMMMFHLTQQFVQQSIPKFKPKPQPINSDSDDDDLESVATENFKPTSGGENQTLPKDILSTPAFPSMIQKLVENQPRPKFAPPKKLEPIIEEVKEFDIDTTKKIPKSKDTKDEQVLVLS